MFDDRPPNRLPARSAPFADLGFGCSERHRYNENMTEAIAIDFDQPVPVFPLHNLVLLPHATVPLHIFESRYRKMVRDAVKGQKLIAMALFDGDEWKEDYQGTPPIRPYVCIGYIIRHEPLPDGRFNILLQGVCRANITEEVPSEPYRMARVNPTEHTTVMEIDLGEQRSGIETLLNDPLLRQLASVSAIQNWLSCEIPTPVLIDLAIWAICDNTEHRYGMLAEQDVQHRAAWLQSQLKYTRQTLATAERFGDGQSADGYSLN